MEAINKQLAAITGSQETDSGVVVEYSNPPYCAICNTNHFKKD